MSTFSQHATPPIQTITDHTAKNEVAKGSSKGDFVANLATQHLELHSLVAKPTPAPVEQLISTYFNPVPAPCHTCSSTTGYACHSRLDLLDRQRHRKSTSSQESGQAIAAVKRDVLLPNHTQTHSLCLDSDHDFHCVDNGRLLRRLYMDLVEFMAKTLTSFTVN